MLRLFLFLRKFFHCHSREGGNPGFVEVNWIPAFAGMTQKGRDDSRFGGYKIKFCWQFFDAKKTFFVKFCKLFEHTLSTV
jgi:hypothetical protein